MKKKSSKRWFKKAVMDKPPYKLGGWEKTQSAATRRRHALSSRPKTMKLKNRYLSAARALQALANVTKDKPTKAKAQADADYFYHRRSKS